MVNLSCQLWNLRYVVKSGIPSPLLRSDRAFRLFAASARRNACCSFCLSCISFSRLLRAAAPLSFCEAILPVPFVLFEASCPGGSGDSLCLDTVEDELDPVRCRLLLAL